jgi:hypothetical protein
MSFKDGTPDSQPVGFLQWEAIIVESFVVTRVENHFGMPPHRTNHRSDHTLILVTYQGNICQEQMTYYLGGGQRAPSPSLRYDL